SLAALVRPSSSKASFSLARGAGEGSVRDVLGHYVKDVMGLNKKKRDMGHPAPGTRHPVPGTRYPVPGRQFVLEEVASSMEALTPVLNVSGIAEMKRLWRSHIRE
ncbi:MAG: hypothetical protein WBQ03_22460, partial [Candidatus Sulfotelmatobacter sp.]